MKKKNFFQSKNKERKQKFNFESKVWFFLAIRTPRPECEHRFFSNIRSRCFVALWFRSQDFVCKIPGTVLRYFDFSWEEREGGRRKRKGERERGKQDKVWVRTNTGREKAEGKAKATTSPRVEGREKFSQQWERDWKKSSRSKVNWTSSRARFEHPRVGPTSKKKYIKNALTLGVVSCERNNISPL